MLPPEVLILVNSGKQKASPKAGFSNLVGDRGLLATSWLALRAVADATFSRFARVEPLAPGGSHPLRLQMQKTLLVEQGFKFGR